MDYQKVISVWILVFTTACFESKVQDKGTNGTDPPPSSVSPPDGDTDAGPAAPSDTQTSDTAIVSESDSDSDSDSARTTDSETETCSEDGLRSTDSSSEVVETDAPKDTACDFGAGPRIEAVHVERNPSNVLSCFVTWQTDVPSTGTVYFGDEAYSYRVTDDTVDVEHRVLLIGLHADSIYRIKVVATVDAPPGRSSATLAYRTGVLPPIVPELTPGPEGATPTNASWTLLNVYDSSSDPAAPAVAAMYDDFGKPVWYFIDGQSPDTRGDIDVRLLDNEHVLIGATALEPAREVDLAGNVVWEGPPQQGYKTMHHHFEKDLDGNYLTLRHVRENNVGGDIVESLSPELDVLWQWNIFDHLSPPEGKSGDWTHANSVTLDDGAQVLYLNSRNLDTLFKISMEGEQQILWRLGPDGDFAPDPNAEYPWFANQHDPEIQPNGNILVYDNGNMDRPHSRVVEYALDETAMQSEIVFEFPGDFDVDSWYEKKWYATIFGDADRLDNGNIQVTYGTRQGGSAESRVFEITEAGEVVRELRFPQHNDKAIGVYRAARLFVPPHVEVLCDPAQGCDLEGCAAKNGDFDSEPNFDTERNPDTETEDTEIRDGGADSESVLDAGEISDGGLDTDIDLFPVFWGFDADWDGFLGEAFTRDEAAGIVQLDYTFTGQETDPPVLYRSLDGRDWTGLGEIAIRLRTVDFRTGGYTIAFLSGYGWSWCSMYMSHEEATDWTTISMNMNTVCDAYSLYPDMVQQIGILVEPGAAAVFPEHVRVEIDWIAVTGNG